MCLVQNKCELFCPSTGDYSSLLGLQKHQLYNAQLQLKECAETIFPLNPNNSVFYSAEMILTRLSCWLWVGGWGITGEGGNTGSHRRRNGRDVVRGWRGRFFLSVQVVGKKGRKPEQGREAQTSWGEMDGGGGTGARALLIGRLCFSLWMDWLSTGRITSFTVH